MHLQYTFAGLNKKKGNHKKRKNTTRPELDIIETRSLKIWRMRAHIK
jgi:hypothetical protein